jgi:peptide/nickel transport system permease protein
MGKLLLVAVAQRDTPVILGATLAYATAVIAANLVAELLLPLVDPRRRA